MSPQNGSWALNSWLRQFLISPLADMSHPYSGLGRGFPRFSGPSFWSQRNNNHPMFGPTTGHILNTPPPAPLVQFPHAGSTTTFFWPTSSTVQVCQTRGLATRQHSTSAHHNCPGPGDPCAQFFKRGKWGCCQFNKIFIQLENQGIEHH